MYSGLTLTKLSGSFLGAHQKIDRLARRQLENLVPGIAFPDTNSILHFEGDHGPDGIKRKQPGNNEWHFIDPFDLSDVSLIEFIDYHYKELVNALKTDNQERTSFEAAWLAHAIVDGLTPAHHYPYEQKLTELRNGQGVDTRKTVMDMLVMPGKTGMNAIKNNWKAYGPKGLVTTHAAFEMGFASLIVPLSFSDLEPATDYVVALSKKAVGPWFRSLAQQIAKLNIYETFYKTGWTLKLSNQVKQELTPALINAVTAVWYSAYQEAHNSKKSFPKPF